MGIVFGRLARTWRFLCDHIMGNLTGGSKRQPTGSIKDDNESSKKPHRFKVGDRVACNTDDGWQEGEVIALDYREDEWPKTSKPAPYQVLLDEGKKVYAPRDDDELIVAVGKQPKEPWHVKLARELRSSRTEAAYPPVALHKQLFKAPMSEVSTWFIPEFLDALAGWTSSQDVGKIDVSALPGVRCEAPGVVSFNCLTHEFCDMLLAEANNYQKSGFPQRAPNSMNNYGLVLNEIGLKSTFDTVLKNVILGIGARLFGDDETRETHLHGEKLYTQDWGGSTLSSHHTFIVRYRPDEDRYLDMHVDECDVTFNFGLTDADGFEGSDLAFCGMFADSNHRKHLHTYKHVKGRCVVHSGKRRHGALNIKAGERASLIMWTRSDSFRWTPAYNKMWGGGSVKGKEDGPPDRVCLSETHDRDYDKWMRTFGSVASM